MNEYIGKTVEEALATASEELKIPVEELIYLVTAEKAGLLKKKVIIEVYDLADIIEYAERYILNVLDSLEIESTVKSKIDDEIIRITIDSTHNPIIIGKNGKTLQALNEVAKLAVSNHFHKKFRILLDVNGYKDKKYYYLSKMARRYAHDVQKTKTTYTFDPMSADERRIIHNAVSGMPNIRTESVGEGNHRQVQIIYVE